MSLTKQQIKNLRQRAHHLKPVIIIGNNGLTEAVHDELERTLEHHELIKVRINAQDNDAKQQITARICKFHRATMINSIGHIVSIYRKKSPAN